MFQTDIPTPFTIGKLGIRLGQIKLFKILTSGKTAFVKPESKITIKDYIKYVSCLRIYITTEALFVGQSC